MNQKMKTCSCCQKNLAVTAENYYFVIRNGQKCPRSKCKSCLSDYNKKYRRENRSALRKSHKRYDSSPKGIYKKLIYSPRKHKVSITQKSFVEWYKFQPKKCYYCGIPAADLKKAKDAYNQKTNRLTIDRMDSSGEYAEGNIVLCCLRCNHIKGDFFTALEMVEIGRKYIAPKWRTNAKEA